LPYATAGLPRRYAPRNDKDETGMAVMEHPSVRMHP
jgi:hypothetical protein